VIGGADQIVGRSGGGIDGALGIVLRDVWIVAEEILDRRIPASLRNLIIGKGSPVPALASRGLAERIRAKSRRSRIVNLVQAAGRVSELGGHSRREKLDLLERVYGGGGDLVGGPDHGAHRFLAADSIDRVPERPLALTDDVLAVDVRGGRQIQKNPERILLQNRNLDDRFAFQNLARRRRLGFQQGSRRGHL